MTNKHSNNMKTILQSDFIIAYTTIIENTKQSKQTGDKHNVINLITYNFV